MTTHDDRSDGHSGNLGEPSIGETAALTARLRDLSHRAATPAELAQFQADKHALLARIPASTEPDTTDTDRPGIDEASTDSASSGSNGAAAAVVPAERLREGDQFVHGGQVHRVDDDPIAHDGVLTVPTTNDAGDARTVDLPDDAHVTAQLTDDPDRTLEPAEQPAGQREGSQSRRTHAARHDDRAGMHDRLVDLGTRIAAEGRAPAGGWRTVAASAAAEELARRGTNPDTARDMVEDYLRDTSARADVPIHGYGLDQADIDAIAATHHLPADGRGLDDTDSLTDGPTAHRDYGDREYGDGEYDGAGWTR